MRARPGADGIQYRAQFPAAQMRFNASVALMGSATVAAPLVAPHRVKTVLLGKEAGLRRTETAGRFHAPLVVVEGESLHSGDLDLAVRVVQQRGHRLGEYRRAVSALSDCEAGLPPYRRPPGLLTRFDSLPSALFAASGFPA